MNEELELAKVSLKNANDYADIKSNPVVESVLMPIVKAVPVIGDMIDSSMNKVIEEFQEKKEKELIQVILKDKNSITSDMVNDVEFIVNFAKTREAVRRLATNDKVKYFGNLIRNGYLSGEHIENSEFEEYLDILNTMSYREIQYLVDYFKFCNGRHLNGVERLNIWFSFLNQYSSRMKVRQHFIYSIFSRIAKTGFVEAFYVTASGGVDGGRTSEAPAEQDGFVINKSFDSFYNMVLKMEY